MKTPTKDALRDHISRFGSGRDCYRLARDRGDPDGRLYRRCANVGGVMDCYWMAVLTGDPAGILAARIKMLEGEE